LKTVIHGIFVDPPIAIARLGGSSVPQDAYRWAEADNPRSEGNTVIAPWWTLDVTPGGSVEPRMPSNVRLRDGDLIRPVAPFFEVWALVGGKNDAPSKWREMPLTAALLKECGLDQSAITIQVDAKNRKAARRRASSSLTFGTFPPLAVTANDHGVHMLHGVSPPDAETPMVPRDRAIPMGYFQVMKSRPQPQGANVGWEGEVNVDVIRFRFTPAKGEFYGPPQAALQTETHGIAVSEENAFLDPDAGWFSQATERVIEPADTYDILRADLDTGPSLGVVDDTCEARIEVTLALPGRGAAPLKAHANVFVGPPDFAPDRRPFLSLADELLDRTTGGQRRSAAMTAADRDAWVEDLFERIYETVSLFNLDHFQNDRSILLKGNRLRRKPIPGDGAKTPRDHAMTHVDALRNPSLTVGPTTRDQPLPLSEHARTRHRALQDIDALRELIAERPERLEALIRRPFEVQADETFNTTTMRMPPFMRNSNAMPLTLSFWQYDLLMDWVASVRKSRLKSKRTGMRRMSKQAADRRALVLARLDRGKAP